MSDTTQEPSPPTILNLPDFALVCLIGASGSGKSTFARKHFLPTEVLSSDGFRALVSDDENSLDATNDAFDALHYLATIRLRRRKMVVVDATNVQPDSRKPLLKLAEQHDALAVAIVLNVPEEVCQERNRARPDRSFGPHVVRNHVRDLRRSLRNLKREGFRYVFVLDTQQAIETVQFERTPLWTDRRTELGPFDIIGDIHGCADEFLELLGRLGYVRETSESAFSHPDGRRAIFLGDLVDRGPGVVTSARIAMSMVAAGTAICVPGNHDIKLARALQGKNVQMTHGLPESLEQIEQLTEEEQAQFKRDFVEFVEKMVSHFVLDEGRLVVAHAGMKEEYQGRASGRVRDFAIWGDTTGETDDFGLPIRYPWADDYRGRAMVVYGHTPVPEPLWHNNTINLDTGCVFGGKLTALRYPEREIVQVDSHEQYAVPAKPFIPTSGDSSDAGRVASQARENSDLLDAADVLGKRVVQTELMGRVTVRAENAAAAFEVMSRFAVDPRWLLYLPPTMSPSETTTVDGYLEYPDQAFAYFRNQGVGRVVCQTKHMGSRAVVVVCRDEDSVRKRFGTSDSIGECYTRTGRRFFDDDAVHNAFIQSVNQAVTSAGLWDELETDWLCLDCELMPWNAKAQALLREQYGPVGAAAKLSLSMAQDVLQSAVGRGLELTQLYESISTRAQDIESYTKAYAQYCWPVNSLDDYKLAAFHLLASEGKTYFHLDHDWHVSTLSRLSTTSSLIIPTDSVTVDLSDEDSVKRATQWWVDYTEGGGEGMVVKPHGFIARGQKGLIQPAVKVRGREYLRIIYGPEYTEPENLARLRQRGLNTKRSLALREFALGVEGLQRHARHEGLRRVHECVFAILALESEPVDPRL